MKVVRTVLMGLGTVNRGWLHVLLKRREEIRSLFQRDFTVVAVADSSGVAASPDGMDGEILLALKPAGRKVKDLDAFLPGRSVTDVVKEISADLVIESSPGNLVNGEPGVSVARAALSKGIHVVFANKAPLVFAFDEWMALCGTTGGRVAYSATVCGGLPVVNVLQRDLKLARVKRIRGIFNATSNFVLRELENGGTLESAIREAQRLGAAEADPTHDLNGHDTANKLYIIMKSFAGFNGTIQDIRTEGILSITAEELASARSKGGIIKLVAEAIPAGSDWKLSVIPTILPRASFLGSCEGWEMGFEIETDLYERICMKNYEADPLGTSAAVMRDCLEVTGE